MEHGRAKIRFGLFLAFIFLTLCGVAGCAREGGGEADYYIYYLNQDMTGLEPVEYEPKTTTGSTEALTGEFLSLLDADTDNVEYGKLYPDYVNLERYDLNNDNGLLSLYFNDAYSEMEPTQEVLSREAIVQTMLQIPDITGVSFLVGGEPLTDTRGDEVGVMTLDSFLDNPSEEINDIQVADLTLYFASEDGDSLVAETQHVYYYSSNISMEKLVMEQLLKGPVSDNAQSAIPEDTGLISVSVLDGTCVVNFDENFLAQNYDIQEDVVIYSIVDSLTELSTVDAVQIEVNGDDNMVYRQDMSLSEIYTQNLSLITEEGEDVDVDQEEQEEEGLLDTGK